MMKNGTNTIKNNNNKKMQLDLNILFECDMGVREGIEHILEIELTSKRSCLDIRGRLLTLIIILVSPGPSNHIQWIYIQLYTECQ